MQLYKKKACVLTTDEDMKVFITGQRLPAVRRGSGCLNDRL